MRKKIKCAVCARLKEPSTWAGFAAPLGVLGTQIPAPYTYIAYGIAAMCSVLAVLLGEGSHETDTH